MDFLFEAKAKKMEKEAALRNIKAQQRREKELKNQEEQKEREELQHQLAITKRIEREVEEARIREEEEAVRMKTHGIAFHERGLIPYLLPDAEDDKVILPETFLSELNRMNAFSHGPLIFQINTQETAGSTHCGVREFSATEGTIGLPQKVIDSLAWEGTATVSIRYTGLPKVTFAKLAPVGDGQALFSAVGPIKACLEENLRLHTTLTEGDQLTVWYRGRPYPVRVTELRPESAGALLDTDVEIEFDVSDGITTSNPKQGSAVGESERAGTAAPEPSEEKPPALNVPSSTEIFHKVGNRLGGLSPIAPSSSSSSSGSSAPSAPASTSRPVDPMEVVEIDHGSSSVAVPSVPPPPLLLPLQMPDEPAADEVDCISLRVRCTGSTQMLSRRFLAGQPVALLFHFLSSALVVPVERVVVSARLGGESASKTFSLSDVTGSGTEEVASFAGCGFGKREMVVASVVK